MKSIKNKSIIFLIEGETEQSVLKAIGCIGKYKKINLWNTSVHRIFSTLRADILFIIYDTDRLENISVFQENLNFLDKNKVQYYLLQQTKNLEDELIRCSDCKKLKDFFNTASVSEFKTALINCNNLKRVFESKQVRYHDLWQGATIKTLQKWNKKRAYYENLYLR